MEYFITRHLRERFVQRTDRKYQHLQHCARKDCPDCTRQTDEIRRTCAREHNRIDAEISERLAHADEDRSYLNNSGFMDWYFRKYGTDKRFAFLVGGDILFVVVIECSGNNVVTCVSAKTHLAGKQSLARPKFNRVRTKEEKQRQNY